MLNSYSGRDTVKKTSTNLKLAAMAAAAAAADEPNNDAPKPRAFKRARRVDSTGEDKLREKNAPPLGGPTSRLPQQFALLDLDGTLFHMMPEGELPGNIGNVTEAVVPLPDGAMRKLMKKPSDSSAPAPPCPNDELLDTRHLMAVRRGTRQLLAGLRASGVDVRVITANLLGDVAVESLVVREDAEVAVEGAKAALDVSEKSLSPRGWSGKPAIRVTVVVDRAPGSKRLPDDVVDALRNDPKGTRVVILDDNPTAWEARAREHIWIVPQFDVRRPLTRSELDDELGLLDRISDRCRRFFPHPEKTQRAISPPPSVGTSSENSRSSSLLPPRGSRGSSRTNGRGGPLGGPTLDHRQRSAAATTRAAGEKTRQSRSTRRKPDDATERARRRPARKSSSSSRNDYDDEEEDDPVGVCDYEGSDSDAEDPEWEQALQACCAAKERAKKRRRRLKESDDDESDEEVIESAELPS
ncbi:hypothetical protein CTAYLR_006079 [Chrysophaeum taylorii]|uniref:FCP1 homology domain-containing protein n=1 Tax=Chrysophaeum taylorii TaxID=2483200 RepID=A0AAD7XPS5_9STRA|nr:hypothetical protein CTAYLR_006079 [Chrysophaeum taylorii]